MPIYEYDCTKCGKQHEIMQKITEKPLTKCPECGGKMKKLISNTSFVLKGTGWYATDYASDKNKTVSTAKAEKTGDKKTEVATKETKSETKSETKTEKTTGTATASK